MGIKTIFLCNELIFSDAATNKERFLGIAQSQPVSQPGIDIWKVVKRDNHLFLFSKNMGSDIKSDDQKLKFIQSVTEYINAIEDKNSACLLFHSGKELEFNEGDFSGFSDKFSFSQGSSPVYKYLLNSSGNYMAFTDFDVNFMVVWNFYMERDRFSEKFLKKI